MGTSFPEHVKYYSTDDWARLHPYKGLKKTTQITTAMFVSYYYALSSALLFSPAECARRVGSTDIKDRIMSDNLFGRHIPRFAEEYP